ncbi:hypothetical protein G7Y89_g4597 [Cudoniella acicularis]|uniref:Uncharacterized protein n=1 Tax=Cudoniella acicularis TaxID=354080 RepID=A0A8H4RQK1_9HELO|nr:hypothetical protein G7Y89_g4597 [Cudoniella acicularis]
MSVSTKDIITISFGLASTVIGLIALAVAIINRPPRTAIARDEYGPLDHWTTGPLEDVCNHFEDKLSDQEYGPLEGDCNRLGDELNGQKFKLKRNLFLGYEQSGSDLALADDLIAKLVMQQIEDAGMFELISEAKVQDLSNLNSKK